MPAFVDYVNIHLKSGDGGNGCVSFRREKGVPRGGPNGGDGGDGGSVFLEAHPGMATLLDLKYRPYHKAERGGHGQGKNKHGKNGKDVIIKVPLGTVVSEDGQELVDLTKPGQRFCAARGGKGGRGNQHFATSVNRAPRYAEPGRPGEERRLTLELKLIADVGLVGLPNAGKSTLLSHITRAAPKVDSYPFTTLHPNLGVYMTKTGRHIVIADIPGLIEGASKGAGLGDRFLRHIVRTTILVHLIAFDDVNFDFDSLWEKYEMILKELSTYSKKMTEKKSILVLNKIDLVPEEIWKDSEKKFSEKGLEVIPISAIEETNLEQLMNRVDKVLTDIETKKDDDDD